ncbi:MAG: sigma-70 family RNA polymerase sigma factor [Ardenticatenaceae bacterium]|nr:sigma-70 family RNA polymerase sigma factor [Ardenticatenaceae bacterium]MCB8949308.1 sigma-70 family RNA polymerase sigma factor [Ardenticatenaceae bacterium]
MHEIAELVINASNGRAKKETRQEAFAQLVSEFYETAFGWAYSRLRDADVAQDAVQEAFVVAYQQLHQLNEPQAFAGWFKQIVLSQVYRLLRDTRPLAQAVDLNQEIVASEPGPVALLENVELKERVMTAVQALPEKEQVVTQMFYLNGYSQKEIARLLELPLTTVKKRLQYARRNLRGILASMMDAFVPEPEPTPAPVPIPVRSRPIYPPEPPEW